MASTYEELYSDFIGDISRYTQNATITDTQFMRYLSIAAQEFQRMTKVVMSEKKLFRADSFALGDDVHEIVELQDAAGNKLLSMPYNQFRLEYERVGADLDSQTNLARYYNSGSRAETVYRYDIDKRPPDTGNDDYGAHTRIWTVLYNSIVLYPDQGDEYLSMMYYPDIHAFSKNSPQWSAWFPYNTKFNKLFKEQTLGQELSKWEQAIVYRAVARYAVHLLDKDKSYAMRKEFEAMVAQASKKQQLYKTGSSPYHVSPFS